MEKNVSFSNAPPMVKHKSWDDSEFLKQNTWSRFYISDQKERKKENEDKNTRKNKELNKKYRRTKIREANIALSQNISNDLLTKEPLKEEKNGGRKTKKTRRTRRTRRTRK